MSLEQEGCQFFNDDGSQASATAKAVQDAGITTTLSTPVRLRFLVNVNSTAAPTSAYRLEYKESAQTDYSPVMSSVGPIVLSDSSFISAGGEATTARLIPPSGKSAGGSFTTGRIWDDENGNDTVLMSNDQYTELEWCIKSNSSAASLGQVYSFRVTRQALQAASGNPAFDAISISNGVAFPLAWTHTPVGTPTGVAVAIYNQGATNTVSGVTYGGVAMTLAGIQGSVQIWGLASPPVGAQTVSVAGSGTDQVYGHALTVTNGNTSTVFSGFAGAGGSTVPTGVTIASGVGQLVYDICAFDNGNSASQTADVSQTERSNQGPAFANLLVGTSTKPGATSVTMAWTIGFSTPTWSAAAVSFQ